MSDGFLAIMPYVALTVDWILTAIIFTVAVARRVRNPSMLIGAVAMGMLALWFAALAVTAGPSPVVERRAIAEPLRYLALGVAVLWAAWLWMYARSLITIKRKDDGA